MNENNVFLHAAIAKELRVSLITERELCYFITYFIYSHIGIARIIKMLINRAITSESANRGNMFFTSKQNITPTNIAYWIDKYLTYQYLLCKCFFLGNRLGGVSCGRIGRKCKQIIYDFKNLPW